MVHRSAGRSQEHVRPDCNVDLICDVNGVNGGIFGVPDIKPGCATPTSALQGPSGTFG
jgi:hypothetical protein